ncbi:MAG: MYXO-CTERM sorting domain-containing protein [Polyangiales bacterium]
MVDRRPLFGLLALTAACVSEPAVDATTSEIAIPGPWVPSASARAAAASQRVPVVDPPAVSPLGRRTSTNPFACSCTHPACTPAHPGTRDLNAFLLRRYPFLRAGGTYCCRQNSAATRVPMLSVHATGRAIDLMVPMTGGDADNTLGDQVANWLVENASFIGVQRVIWDRAFWNGERGFGLLSSASLPHTDHLHVELSVDGAARRTAFFTSGASMGTSCTARCDGARLIRSDCSTVDCAATGAPCLAGPPPACGAPPPPEPPEAAVVLGASPARVTPSAAPARFTFIGPHRLFDTRTPEGSARLTRSGASGPVTASSSATFRDWSGTGLPAGTTGAWLNVAAIGVEAAGFATAFTEGQARPPTSTVNYVSGGARANATPVTLGSRGGFTVETINPADVIVDAYGAFAPTGAGLAPVVPRRVLDTRADVTLAANVTREIDVSAPAGAVGVVATVAAIGGDAPGFVTAYPCGEPVPETSSVNFGAGVVLANTVVSRLGGGRLCLRSNVAVDAVVDVTGFLTTTSALTYTALTPQRLLDTRDARSLYAGRLGARQVVTIPIQRSPGMPADVAAAVVNLTAVGSDAPGFMTAFPCGTEVPGTSSVNFPAGGAAGALSVSTLGSGSLCVFASARAHLIVDVLGVWTGAATVMPGDPGDPGDDPPVEPVDAGAPTLDAGMVRADSGTPRVDAGTPAVDAGAPSVDVVTPPTDGGPALTDAGATRDDGELSDGGEVITGGCGCRATGRAPRGAWLAGVLALAVLRRRRE